MLGPETSFLCRIESPESSQVDSVASALEKVVSDRRVFISWGLAFDRLCNVRTEVRGVAIRPTLRRLSRLSLRAFIVVSPEREGTSAH